MSEEPAISIVLSKHCFKNFRNFQKTSHGVLFDIVESLRVKFYQRKENPMMFRSVSGLLLLDIESHAFL